MLVGCVATLREIDQIKPLADLIELRLDRYEIAEKPDFPCIFTFRKTDSEEKIEKYLELEPEYCDIDADRSGEFIERLSKRFPKTKLIGSTHNFKETPEDLDALLQKMKNPHFFVYKIAVTAQSSADMLRLMQFARNSRTPLCAISMGEFGKPSRVLGPIIGNVFDYAGLEEDLDLHRYSLKTLHEVFHYRDLNRETLIYALVGDPVEKSPSDLFHNPRFKHNAVYVKMRVSSNEVHECFEFFRKLPFGGLSVTIPLKELVMQEVDEVRPITKSIGAINTVIIRKRKFIGTNTDAPGALNALEKHCSVKGKRLAILGAGGTARAITYEAIKRGAQVLVFNRTLERAKKFHEASFELKDLKEYDILVNTIPPHQIDVPPIRPNTVVMDVVYDPKETPLLAAAKALDCTCVYGEEMFIEQALLQQKEWHF